MQAERRGITDEGLQHLTSLTSLTDIDLSGNLEVGDNGIRFLGGLTGLASLDLHNCRQVTAAGLASLNAIAGNLTTLNLQSCRLSAQGPFPFASFTSLADLNIHFTGFLMDSDRMQALMPLRLLSSLTLDVRGDQAILSLKEFPYLRALQIIWGFSITDACCQNLAHSTGLTSLSLDTSIRLTDNGLKALAALTGLQSLSLNSSRGLTCKGVAAMCPPGLTSLNLKGCDWAASSMPPLLSSLQSLKILTLTHCSGINSDPALSRVLSAIPVGLEQLTIINVDGMAGREEITQEGLLLLNRLSSLTHLHLQFDGMTDGAMNSLSPLSNLTRLNLYRCTNLGSRALYPLVKLTKLTNLVMEASVPDTELRVLQSKFLTALTTCANLAMTYPHRRRSLDLDDYSESQFMTMNSIGNQNNIP